jgi:hypothetical protein
MKIATASGDKTVRSGELQIFIGLFSRMTIVPRFVAI